MSTYKDVLHQARNLTPEEQLHLIYDLISIVRHQVIPKPKHSIMELRGLGKEIWNGVDAQEYVNQERDSWNG